MQYRWPIRGMTVALAVLLLVVGACGGDDDGGEEGGNGDDGPTATLDSGDGGDDSGDGDDDSGDGDEPTSDGGEPTGDGGSGDDDGDDSGDDDDGGSGDDGFAGEVNPCDLLTLDEVSAALGQEVGEGDLRDFDPFFECNWEGDGFDSVILSHYSDDRDVLEAFFEVGNEDSEEIGGIGERAYYDDAASPSIEVLSGNHDILITLTTSEEVDARSILMELAAAAVERLP